MNDMNKMMMMKYIQDSLEDIPEDLLSEVYWLIKFEQGE